MNTRIEPEVKNRIRKLYSDSPLAKDFLDWCAKHQRDVRETKIDRIMHVMEVSRSDAVALAKALDEAGCGEFVVGRRGASSRFVWHHSRINLGQIASGEVDELEEWVEPASEDEEPLTIPKAKTLLAASLGLDPSQIEISIRA